MGSLYQNANNNDVIYERNEFDVDLDLDLDLEIVGHDRLKSEIELKCQLMKLILTIAMML